MYSLINEHIKDILDDEFKEEIIKKYLSLRRWYYETDVSQETRFKTEYKKYWKMQRQSPEFCRCYFQLLKNAKSGAAPTVESIVRNLHVDVNAVHFVFATKLVHMCQPHLPIYDSRVKAFFLLPDREGNLDARLPLLLQDYEFLIGEYKRVLQKQLLKGAIDEVRAFCDDPAELTDERIIDALIWAFVTWARKNPGRFQYR